MPYKSTVVRVPRLIIDDLCLALNFIMTETSELLIRLPKEGETEMVKNSENAASKEIT